TGGAEPSVARLATNRAGKRGAAADVGPVDIALDTVNPIPGLPVVADGAADEAAGDIEIAGVESGKGRRRPIAPAPGAAAVDTDIEPRPIVDRRQVRGGRRHRIVARRQIRRESRPDQRGQSDTRKQHATRYATHYSSPPLSSVNV